jgi:peptidoglycan LD-endopeptidase LytH
MRKLVLAALILIVAGVTVFLAAMIWISASHQSGSAVPPEKAAVQREAGPRLVIPVAGVRAGELVDTYANARAGGRRSHDAIDIMAPGGTPVVAAAEGTVEKLYFSRGGGGVTAYVRSPDGRWLYYYAHLQSYAPGLSEGRRVEAGDPIGRVGSTGNASAAGPHLHFAVYRMAPGERFYQGTPINPYPLLAGRWAARR